LESERFSENDYFIILSEINKIIIRIPIRETINRKSAIVSSFFSFVRFDVRIEIKEKIEAKVSERATADVNSSI